MSNLSEIPGIGIVFRISDLNGSDKFAARHLFMHTFAPQFITSCILLEGKTELTLTGDEDEYCIAIYGEKLDLTYVRNKALDNSSKGFAPYLRRIIEKPALDTQPLVPFGAIDRMGRLIVKYWSQIEHDLSLETNWGYAPQKTPKGLTSKTIKELAKLAASKTPSFYQRQHDNHSSAKILKTKPNVVSSKNYKLPSTASYFFQNHQKSPDNILAENDIEKISRKASEIIIRDGPSAALEYLRPFNHGKDDDAEHHIKRRIQAITFFHQKKLASIMDEPWLDWVWCQCSICEHEWLIMPLFSSPNLTPEDLNPVLSRISTRACQACGSVFCSSCSNTLQEHCTCGELLSHVDYPNGRTQSTARDPIEEMILELDRQPGNYIQHIDSARPDIHLYFGTEGIVPIAFDTTFPTIQTVSIDEHLYYAEILFNAGLYMQAEDQLDIIGNYAKNEGKALWLSARLDNIRYQNFLRRRKQHKFDPFSSDYSKLKDRIIKKIDQAVELNPSYSSIWLTRAQIYLDENISLNPLKALKSAQTARKLSGDIPEILLAEGTALSRMGDYDKAINFLQRVSKKSGAYRLSRKELYHVELRNRCNNEHFDLDAHYNLAYWLWKQPKLREQVTSLLRKIIPQAPESEQRYLLEALQAWINIKQPEKRLKQTYLWVKKATNKNPHLGRAWELLGMVHQERIRLIVDLGSEEDAVSCYKRAILEDPRCDIALLSLAQLHIDAGEIKPALAYLEQAAEQESEDESVYMILAAIYLGLRQFDKQAWALERRAELDPEFILQHEYEQRILNLCEFEY
jgi:lipopolysaccharide biosynthesis regulator YciM